MTFCTAFAKICRASVNFVKSGAVTYILGAFTKLRKATISSIIYVCLSVCLSFRMQQLGSHWTDFHETLYLSIFRKSVEKIQDSLIPDKNNGTLNDDLCTFITVSRWILLRVINVSDKSCRENQNTHYLVSENRALYYKKWKKMVQPDRPHVNIIRPMRFECWTNKAREAHSEYLILTVFPRQ
jgi:hypothetical protein